MKNNFTPLVDDHLQSISGMQEATTDDFFYTRLKGRMQEVRTPAGMESSTKTSLGDRHIDIVTGGEWLYVIATGKNKSCSQYLLQRIFAAEFC